MTSSRSVGEQLKAARTALQVSVKEVTKVTKIQPWVLEALEANRLHTSMSQVYVKSFLTTYAKFLRLDANHLIAQLFPEPVPSTVAPPSVNLPAPAPPCFLAKARTGEAAGAQAGVVQARPWAVAVGEAVWPWIRRLVPVAIGLVGIAVLIMVHPVRWLSTRIPRHEASVSVPTVTSDRVPAETLLSLQPTQPLELAIVTSRPTWVSVKADGQLIAQQQLPAGSKEIWKARRRFELIVAKPSQVEVRLNGQSISPLAMSYRGRLLITHKSIKPLGDLPAPASAAQADSSR